MKPLKNIYASKNCFAFKLQMLSKKKCFKKHDILKKKAQNKEFKNGNEGKQYYTERIRSGSGPSDQ